MVPPAVLLVSPWSDPTWDAGKCPGRSLWDGEGLKNFAASAKCPGDLELCLLSAGSCCSLLQQVVSACPLGPLMSATLSPPVLMPRLPISNPYVACHMYLSFPTSLNSESLVPSHQQNHAVSASLPLSALTGSDLFLHCFLVSSSRPFLYPENTLVWILCHLTVFSTSLPCWGLYSKACSPTGLVMSAIFLSSTVSVLICDDFISCVGWSFQNSDLSVSWAPPLQRPFLPSDSSHSLPRSDSRFFSLSDFLTSTFGFLAHPSGPKSSVFPQGYSPLTHHLFTFLMFPLLVSLLLSSTCGNFMASHCCHSFSGLSLAVFVP